MNLVLTGLVAFTIILIGCNNQSVQRAEHAPARPGETVVQAAPVDRTADKEKFDAVDLGKLRATAEGGGGDQTTVLSELENYVMNPAYLDNPRYSGSKRMVEMLAVYNQALTKLSAAGGLDDKRLQNYVDTVLAGCDQSMHQCKHTRFFRTDPSTADILLLRAQQLSQAIEKEKSGATCQATSYLDNVRDLFRILGVAMEFGNAHKADDLEFLYVKYSRDQLLYFDCLPTERRSAEAVQKHGRIFERLLTDATKSSDSPEFKKFLLAADGWQHSNLEKHPFPYGVKKILELTAKNLMYADTDKKALHASLNDAIKLSQKTAVNAEPSFSDRVRLLRQDAAVPFLFHTMQLPSDLIDRPQFFNEYFYMIDRVYFGHLNATDATMIWLASNQDNKKLVEINEYYLKIQLLYMVKRTNEFMRGVYAKQNADGEALFYQTLEESRGITYAWQDTLERIEKVSDFLTSQLKRANDAAANQRAHIFLNSLRRNIKYISVYPNMMMLAYFLRDLKGEIKHTTMWGDDIKFQAEEVINSLFAGRQGPWFRFANDLGAINSLEILFAYYFALNTGTFESFSKEASGLSVTREKFFSNVVMEILNFTNSGGKNLKQMETNVEKARIRASQDQNFRNYCRLAEQGAAFSINQVNIFELDDHLIFEKLIKHGVETYNTTGGVLNSVQDTYLPRLKRVRIMYQLLEQNASVIQAAGVKVDASALQKIKAEIDQAEKIMRDSYAVHMDIHRDYFRCLMLLNGIERKTVYDVLRKEAEYLGRVYDGLIKIRELPDFEQKAAEFGKQQGWQDGLDQFSDPDTFVYNKYQALLRFRMYLAQHQPAVLVSLPAAESLQGNLALREGFSLSVRDSENKITSREAFIASGLQRIIKSEGSDGLFKFWSGAYPVFDFRSLLKPMVATYKVGRAFKEEKLLPAEDMIDLQTFLVDMINIKPEEVPLLKSFGRRTKYDEQAHIETIILEEKTRKPLAFLEGLYDQIRDYDDVWNDAQEFAVAEQSLGYFLFAPSKETQALFLQNYVDPVFVSEAAVLEFEKAARAREQATAPFEATYELSPSDTFVWRSGDHDGHARLLSEVKVRDFGKRMRRLHEEETFCLFLEGERKAECMKNAKLSEHAP